MPDAISSVSSSNAAAAVAQSEAMEPRGRDVKNDQDSDDRGAAVAAPKPTVNTQGQIIGTLLSTQA